MVPNQRPANSLCANTSFCLAVPYAMIRFALPVVSRWPPDPPMLAFEKKPLATASTT